MSFSNSTFAGMSTRAGPMSRIGLRLDLRGDLSIVAARKRARPGYIS